MPAVEFVYSWTRYSHERRGPLGVEIETRSSAVSLGLAFVCGFLISTAWHTVRDPQARQPPPAASETADTQVPEGKYFLSKFPEGAPPEFYNGYFEYPIEVAGLEASSCIEISGEGDRTVWHTSARGTPCEVTIAAGESPFPSWEARSPAGSR